MQILFCESCFKVYACLGERVYLCDYCFASEACVFRKKTLNDFPNCKITPSVNGYCINCIERGML